MKLFKTNNLQLQIITTCQEIGYRLPSELTARRTNKSRVIILPFRV